MTDTAWYLEQRGKTAAKLYHGSRSKITELRAGTYVTPYKEDALSFAVPWSSTDLVNGFNNRPGGRPPAKLKFKSGRTPSDRPIYLYEVETPTEAALTNTGRKYDWNQTTTGPSKVKLIKTLPSWKAELLDKTAFDLASIPISVGVATAPQTVSRPLHLPPEIPHKRTTFDRLVAEDDSLLGWGGMFATAGGGAAMLSHLLGF